jgi:hypothetical protein
MTDVETAEVDQETTPSIQLDVMEQVEYESSRYRQEESSSMGYTSPTAVQPKGRLEEYKLASQEYIQNVFSTGKSPSCTHNML